MSKPSKPDTLDVAVTLVVVIGSIPINALIVKVGLEYALRPLAGPSYLTSLAVVSVLSAWFLVAKGPLTWGR